MIRDSIRGKIVRTNTFTAITVTTNLCTLTLSLGFLLRSLPFEQTSSKYRKKKSADPTGVERVRATSELMYLVPST